jgi:hypothetical protein
MAGAKKKPKHAGKRAKKREVTQVTTPVVSVSPPASESRVPAVDFDDGTVPDLVLAPKSRGRLSEMVPVRFDPETLSTIKRRAADDRRSVSSWIRRAVDMELDRSTTA